MTVVAQKVAQRAAFQAWKRAPEIVKAAPVRPFTLYSGSSGTLPKTGSTIRNLGFETLGQGGYGKVSQWSVPRTSYVRSRSLRRSRSSHYQSGRSVSKWGTSSSGSLVPLSARSVRQWHEPGQQWHGGSGHSSGARFRRFSSSAAEDETIHAKSSGGGSFGIYALFAGIVAGIASFFSRETEEQVEESETEDVVTEAQAEDEDVIEVSTEDTMTAPHGTSEEQHQIQEIVSTLEPTRPKVTVIMGGGAMTQEILTSIYDRVAKTGSDESVVLFCSDPSRYAELMEIPGIRERLQIRKLGYAMGNNPNFWKAVGEQLVEGGAEEIYGVNTRGGSAIPGRTSFREMNYAPIFALSTGLIAGVDSCAKLAIAQLSTSMASHVERGFRGADGQVDLYGATKLDGDNLLLAQQVNGIIVRLNWGIHSTIPGNCPNHDYALPELVAFVVQPYFGRKDAITLQPVYARNVAAVLTDWRNIDKPMHVIDAVGTPMSMVDAMEVYADHMGRDLKLVKVPIEFMRWLATYAPRGHIQPYAVEYVDSQTKPDRDYTISSKGYDEALSDLGLRRMELAEILEQEEEVFVPPLPIKKHSKEIAHVLMTNAQARKEFMALLPALSVTACNAIGVYVTGRSEVEVEDHGDQ